MQETCQLCKTLFVSNKQQMCDACSLDHKTMQQFFRPDFKPDAAVVPEYAIIPEYSRRKRSQDEVQTTNQRMCLPKTEQRYQNEKNARSNAIEQTQERLPTTLEISRITQIDQKPTFLRKKHPHANDGRIWLDEKDGKHDYHVEFEKGSGKFETEFIQSTSGMIHQYFPEKLATPHELLFTDEKFAWQLAKCKHYFTSEKTQELQEFQTNVLEPLKKLNNAKYTQLVFVNSILRSPKWGPNHDKHGKYFSNDTPQLVRNIRQMFRDWEQKADDGCTRGTFVHYLIELDMNGQLDLSSHPVYSKLTHIRQYLTWKKLHFDPIYEPYATEKELFDSEHRRVGTCDLLAIRKNHPPPSETNGILYLVMFDWKNTVLEKMSYYDEKTGYKTGVGPMKHVHDCNYRHYELQQAEYRKFVRAYRNFTYNGFTYDRVELELCALVCFDDSNPRNEAIVEVLHNTYEHELEEIWRIRKQAVDEWRNSEKKPVSKVLPLQLSDQEYEFVLTHLIEKNKCFHDMWAQFKKNKK